ncbi:MAG: AsmA family protein [Gammaproteobacteria bacterium]|nr:AsmA family protein [Gammaproteobacteria bacterium]
MGSIPITRSNHTMPAMKKFFKRFLYVMLALVLLVISAILALPYLINPNDYKTDIAAWVKHHTGRDLEIDGTIRLSVFPWLGVDIGQLRLHNPATLNNPTFIQIEHAKARLRLVSLFSNELHIGELALQGLQLNLQVQPDGSNNWSDLLNHASATPTPAPSSTNPNQKHKQFRIESIAINNAALHWEDLSAHSHWDITGINLRAGPLRQNSTPLQVSLAFASQQPALQGQLQLTTNLTAQWEQLHIVLAELQLQLDAQGPALPSSAMQVRLDIPTATFDQAQQRVALPSFTLSLDKTTRAQGQFTLQSFDHPKLNAALTIPKLDINPWLATHSDGEITAAATSKPAPTVTTAHISLPAQLNLHANISIGELWWRQMRVTKLQLPLTIVQSRIQVQPTMALYDGELRGEWSLNTQTQPPRWHLHNELRGVSTGPLLQALSGKPWVNGSAEAVADITTEGLSPDALLSHLNGEAQLRLDKTQIPNFDLRAWLLSQVYAQLKQPPPTADNKDRTVFDSARATLHCTNGVLHNRDLLVTTATDQLRGNGEINLLKQSIDYSLFFTRTAPWEITLGDASLNLQNEPIPIPLRGSWQNIAKPLPDILAVIKRLQQQALQKKATAVKDKVKQETKKLLEKLLPR